jgi:hypothetical protein
VISFKSRAK